MSNLTSFMDYPDYHKYENCLIVGAKCRDFTHLGTRMTAIHNAYTDNGRATGENGQWMDWDG